MTDDMRKLADEARAMSEFEMQLRWPRGIACSEESRASADLRLAAADYVANLEAELAALRALAPAGADAGAVAQLQPGPPSWPYSTANARCNNIIWRLCVGVTPQALYDALDAEGLAIVEKTATPTAAGIAAPPAASADAVRWPEPKVTNPDIANLTGVPYLDCLIHRVLDAQQDINYAANESMNQNLSDAASLLDEVETALRSAALSAPVAAAPVGMPGRTPTIAETNSACMSFRHDFGLLGDEEQKHQRFIALEWLNAWQKEAALSQRPNPGGEA